MLIKIPSKYPETPPIFLILINRESIGYFIKFTK
jgi:hypothetical protein